MLGTTFGYCPSRVGGPLVETKSLKDGTGTDGEVVLEVIDDDAEEGTLLVEA